MGAEKIDTLLCLLIILQPIRLAIPCGSKSRLDFGNGVAVDRCPVEIVDELTDNALWS